MKTTVSTQPWHAYVWDIVVNCQAWWPSCWEHGCVPVSLCLCGLWKRVRLVPVSLCGLWKRERLVPVSLCPCGLWKRVRLVPVRAVEESASGPCVPVWAVEESASGPCVPVPVWTVDESASGPQHSGCLLCSLHAELCVYKPAVSVPSAPFSTTPHCMTLLYYGICGCGFTKLLVYLLQ